MTRTSWKSGLGAAVVALVLACPTPQVAQATRRSAAEMALGTAAVLAREGLQVSEDSLTGGFARPGDVKYIRAFLYEGVPFAVVAAGCEDAYDVDLVVADRRGNILAGDKDRSRTALVYGAAPYTGDYVFAVKMHRSTPNGAHWVLVMGNAVP